MTMTCSYGRVFPVKKKGNIADNQKSRLCILGEFQLLLRPIKTEAGYVKPENLISLSKNIPRKGKILIKISSHSYDLGALAWE